MRSGKTLTQLAQALAHTRDKGRDFVVPVDKLSAIQTDAKRGGIDLLFRMGDDVQQLGLNSWSHGQLAGYADVPKAYYDRIRAENPTLAANSVNHGLSRIAGDKRLVRAVDGNVRALVSSKYRRLDSHDLIENVLPGMVDAGMEIVSSEITDRRLYLRALSPRMQAEVKAGDVVQYGIQISNSDVGAGSLRVEPLIMRLVCLNGMIAEHALKKFHTGRSLAVGDDAVELLSDATLRLGEKAFWAEVQDIVKGALRPEVFASQVERMKDATTQQITNFNLEQVVDATASRVGARLVSADTRKSILDALASGSDGAGLTKWGLANAFTYVAERDETLDFDETVELERAGGQIINMSAADWKVVAGKRA